MEELIAMLVARNAETQAWIDSAPGRWASLYSTDPQDWIDRRITTIEEFMRNELVGTYYDLFKDVYGYRPRDFQEMTNKQLEEEIEYLSKENDRQIEENNASQAMSLLKFNELVVNTMAVSGLSTEDTIRYLIEAEDVDGDIGYFEYRYNIPYGSIKKILG